MIENSISGRTSVKMDEMSTLAIALAVLFFNNCLHSALAVTFKTPSLGYGFQRVITAHAIHFPVLIYNLGAIATYEKQIILRV